jgi:hypothetical protein
MPDYRAQRDGTTPATDAAGEYQRQRKEDGERCLVAALDYLARGWSVLPDCPPDHVGVGKGHGRACKDRGKRPLVRWKKYETQRATEAEVRDWWARWPNANVGIALGPGSGLIRVDVDGPGGEKRLRELSAGDLPGTLEFTSGRPNGGRGLLYRIPDGARLRTTAQKPRPGEELRFQAQGAQTVLPPSRHPEGGRYAWKPGHAPGEVAAALAPAWLVEHLREREDAEGGEESGGESDESCAELTPPIRDELRRRLARCDVNKGGRSEPDFALCCWAVRQRLDPDEVWEVVSEVGKFAERGRDYLDRTWAKAEEEVRRGGTNGHAGTSRGASSPGRPSPRRAVRPLPPYQPFPVEALPCPLSLYVRQAAQALGCDVAYVALPALALAAGLIGHTRVIRLKRTWKAASVLWALVIADSGSLKTPAFRLATDYLFAIQHRLDEDFKREQAAYATAKERWQSDVDAAKADGREPPPKPEQPVHRTAFTSDATIEAIAELIDDNPRGLIVSCDELAGWLGSFSRYKGKAGGTDLQRWLSMHSAGGFAYHRRTGDRRRIVVPHAAVSVCGGIQPGILAQAVGDEFLAAGLAARLLMAMPPRPPKKWTELEVAPEVEEKYHRLLDGLFALDFGRDPKGKRAPHALSLDPEAKASWVAWYEAWAMEQAAAEGELASALAKLEEAAARFALVHHVVTHVGLEVDDLRPIGRRSIEAGVTLARWFAAEGRRIYAALSETSAERDTRRLVEFILAHGGRITTRQLQNANTRKYPTADDAKAELDWLAEADLARWVEEATPARGGHATRYLELLPTSDTSDTRPTADRGGETISAPSLFTGHRGTGGYVGSGVDGGEQVSEVSDVGRGGPSDGGGRVSDRERDPGEEG